MFKQRVESNGFAEVIHCWTHYSRDIDSRRRGCSSNSWILNNFICSMARSKPTFESCGSPSWSYLDNSSVHSLL